MTVNSNYFVTYNLNGTDDSSKNSASKNTQQMQTNSFALYIFVKKIEYATRA